MAGQNGSPKKTLSESMLASATVDNTPRIGIVLSSFKGGEEHDGTPVAGLADPQPVHKELTNAQVDGMLRKAMQLGSRGRRISLGGVAGDDWVLVKITMTRDASTDPRVLASLLRLFGESKQGRRFTVAEAAPATPELLALIEDCNARFSGRRFEYVNLAACEMLSAAAPRRTFAAKNPDGIYTLARVFRECDKVITVSPLRTSPVTGVALSVSSYWALAGDQQKLPLLGEAVDVLNDIYLHHPPEYAIVGGSYHHDGTRKIHHNLLIAGSSGLSVDAVAAAVMGFEPAKLPLFDRMELRGFGVVNTDSIWTRGNEIEEARGPFRKPA
ncbi:MAG: DUF362 domain-containing protein [Bryobacterales bacterium]|nr:DUF362 domain-containing protein [Bryobacterales bacterium]